MAMCHRSSLHTLLRHVHRCYQAHQCRTQVPFTALRAAKLHTQVTSGLCEQAGSRYATPDGIIRSDYPPTQQVPGSILNYVLSGCSEHTNRTAIVDGVTGKFFSYGEIIDHMNRFAALVLKFLKAASEPLTVALLTPNSTIFPCLYYGTLAAGAIVSPMNPMYTPSEVALQLLDSGAQILVVAAELESTARAALDLMKERSKSSHDAPLLPKLFVCGSSTFGSTDLVSYLTDPSSPFIDPVERNADEVALLLYSSGTTGKPKGVMLTNGAVTTNSFMTRSSMFMKQGEEGKQDVILGVLPFYHLYGVMAFMTNTLVRSGKIVTLPRFQPNSFIDAIKRNEITILPTVPPLLQFIIHSPAIKDEDLRFCHTVSCGAAPVSKTSVEKFKEKTKSSQNILFQEGYGMTEIMGTHLTPIDDPKIGFCGKLMPHVQAKVIDVDTSKIAEPGERGELWIKTPCVMSGYQNNPQATAETIDADGWLHTGDVAVYYENGFFSIVNRMKELIKCSGFQVSPSEIEDAILSLPGVADVGVVGVPHERYGEVARAYVVRSQSDTRITEEEINRHISQHLARHKQLIGGIKFTTELPKNPIGKLLRGQLTDIGVHETTSK